MKTKAEVNILDHAQKTFPINFETQVETSENAHDYEESKNSKTKAQIDNNHAKNTFSEHCDTQNIIIEHAHNLKLEPEIFPNKNDNKDLLSQNNIITKKVMFANSKRIPPIVSLRSPNLISGKADFFIDTGSQVSLIKSSALISSTFINKNSIIRICSITNDFQYTKGEIKILLEDLPCNLHIIDDVFSMDTPGLIGLDILEKYNGNIDIAKMQLQLGPYFIPFREKEKFIIQANSKQIIYAQVLNQDIEEGFLPEQNIHPDLLLGEALVRNQNGKALVMCINSSDHDIKIDAPVVELDHFDQMQLNQYENKDVNTELQDNEVREKFLKTIFDI